MNEIQILCREIIKEFDELNNRINKAIEYINKKSYSNISKNYEELQNGQIEDLLDILKGIDKE